MIFNEEYMGNYFIKCERCGSINKKHKTYAKKYGDELHFNPPILCSCGNTGKIVCIKNKETSPSVSTTSSSFSSNEDFIKCPKCGSTQITADKKGFGLGKAAAGGVLLGPVGLLGGLVGSKKVMVTCLKCGKTWEAGKV